MKNEWLIQTIREMKVPYECNLDGRTHKAGTKVWERHIYEVDKSTPEAHKMGKYLKEKYYRKLDDKIDRQLKDGLKTFPRYDVYDVTGSYPFRHMGRVGGYDTYEKALKENKYSAEKAKKGESVLIIAKITIHKIIRGNRKIK